MKMMKKLLCAALMLAVLTLCACGATTAKTVDMTAVMPVMMEYTYAKDEMLMLTEDDLLELYGIEAADVKQFAAAIGLNSLKADEIVLLEAVDAEAAKRVKEMLDNRYQSKLNETRNYLPEEFAKIEKCKVSMEGNFVSLIVVSDVEGAEAAYKAAFK